MICLIFICEWSEKEFFFELFQRVYNFDQLSHRRCLHNASDQKMIIFAHPHNEEKKGGKCAFVSPDTYTWSANRAKSIMLATSLTEYTDKKFVVIRDADWIPLDTEDLSWIRSKKTTEINKAAARTWIPVSIFYVKNMIENWYISWIIQSHCEWENMIFEKSILSESWRFDCDKIPDAKWVFNNYIISDYKDSPIKQAQKMWEIIDINQARRKSKTFNDLMDYMDSLFY